MGRTSEQRLCERNGEKLLSAENREQLFKDGWQLRVNLQSSSQSPILCFSNLKLCLHGKYFETDKWETSRWYERTFG